MRFSVLMSVYFKETADNLYQALQSLIYQRVRPEEIVLVKDGKLTDELERTILSFDKENPNLLNIIAIDQNSGLGHALSLGLQACKYDFVARMDSDDISDFHRFETQVEFLNNHPEIDVVGCTLAEFEDTVGDSKLIKKCQQYHKDMVKNIKWRSPMNHATIMFRRQRVVDAGGYFGNTIMFEDYALFIRLWKAGLRFHNLDQILYYMRVDSGLNSIRRRRGMDYLKKELNFLRYVGRIGAFSKVDQIKYAIVRLPLRLIPPRIMAVLYKYFLRKRE